MVAATSAIRTSAAGPRGRAIGGPDHHVDVIDDMFGPHVPHGRDANRARPDRPDRREHARPAAPPHESGAQAAGPSPLSPSPSPSPQNALPPFTALLHSRRAPPRAAVAEVCPCRRSPRRRRFRVEQRLHLALRQRHVVHKAHVSRLLEGRQVDTIEPLVAPDRQHARPREGRQADALKARDPQQVDAERQIRQGRENRRESGSASLNDTASPSIRSICAKPCRLPRDAS